MSKPDFETLLTQAGPLTFTSAMVRAIQAGRKSRTARVPKYQPEEKRPGCWTWRRGKIGGLMHYVHGSLEEIIAGMVACARFAPGDLAYVAEGLHNEAGWAVFTADACVATVNGLPVQWLWKSDVLPSRCMPKILARRILRIVDVRAERVQEITEEQAVAEGIDPREVAARGWANARVGMKLLWDSIHPKPPNDWESNPFVLTYTFQTEATRCEEQG